MNVDWDHIQILHLFWLFIYLLPIKKSENTNIMNLQMLVQVLESVSNKKENPGNFFFQPIYFLNCH